MGSKQERRRFQERQASVFATTVAEATEVAIRTEVVDAILATLDADAEIPLTTNYTTVRNDVDNLRNIP